MVSPDQLAQAFAALPSKRTRCAMGRILDGASEQARARIQAALDAPHVSTNWIMTTLRSAGQPIGKDSLASHRRGACQCE